MALGLWIRPSGSVDVSAASKICFQSEEVWLAAQGGGFFPSALQGYCMRLGEPQYKTDMDLLEQEGHEDGQGARTPLCEDRLR